MKQFFFIIVLTSLFFNYTLAQGLTKNGKVTTSGTEYVNKHGTIGGTTGVDKNGKIVTSGPAIGDAYQGGKIFYFFVDGNPGYVPGEVHGLIAANFNGNGSNTEYYWGIDNHDVTGTSSAIGTGNQNTIQIVNQEASPTTGARICSDLISNGYSDWYLPSFDELQLLYNQRNLIGGFVTYPYLSSTQGDIYSWRGRWFDKNFSGYYGKTSTGPVRAIRSF